MFRLKLCSFLKPKCYVGETPYIVLEVEALSVRHRMPSHTHKDVYGIATHHNFQFDMWENMAPLHKYGIILCPSYKTSNDL